MPGNLSWKFDIFSNNTKDYKICKIQKKSRPERRILALRRNNFGSKSQSIGHFTYFDFVKRMQMSNTTKVILVNKGLYIYRKGISSNFSDCCSCTKRGQLWILSLHVCCNKQWAGFDTLLLNIYIYKYQFHHKIGSLYKRITRKNVPNYTGLW